MNGVPRGQLLRYAAPNLITALALLFGMLSIAASLEGRFVAAGWWIIYAVVSDRLDGLVARLLRATSELGVQLDSLADFMNFGLAPAILVFAALGGTPRLGFEDGAGRVFLMACCAIWVPSAAQRAGRSPSMLLVMRSVGRYSRVTRRSMRFSTATAG